MTPPTISGLLSEAILQEEAGEFQRSLNTALEAAEAARQKGDLPSAAQFLVRCATLLTQAGRFEEALSQAKAAINLVGENDAGVDALIVWGDCSAFTNQATLAETYYHRAADMARLANDTAGLGRAVLRLASRVYLPRGQFDLALKTIENARTIDNTSGSAWAGSFLLAEIYRTIGDHNHMRQALDEMLPFVKPASRTAGAYHLLWAQLTLDEEELEKAQEYLRLTLRIASQTGLPDLNIWGRMEQSRYYRLKDNASLSRDWAEDALAYAHRVGYRYFEGQATLELALAYWKCDDLQGARQALDDAYELFQACQATYELTRVAFFRSALYRQTEDAEADRLWEVAANQIQQGGYAFLLELEHELAFPLMAAHLRNRNPDARRAAEVLLHQLGRVPPPPMRIFGLGQFTIWQGRRRILDQAWQRRKAGELFRYLLLKPNRSAGRDEILDDLWGEYAPDNAHDLFHQATSTLRHILEPDIPDKFPSRYLAVEGDRVYLLLPPGSQVDFEQFETMTQRALQVNRIEALERALASYIDDLFPMDRYKDWSAGRREVLAGLRLRAYLALGQAYLSLNRHLEALDCARRAQALDSWNEDAALLGMKVCAQLNDAPRALRIYIQIEKTLQEELDILPRSDLRALAEELRRRP